MNLYVLRHGESVANEKGLIQGPKCDFGLSKNGIVRTKMLARRLRQKIGGIRRIIASPLKSTQQTAEIIGNEFRLPMIIDNSLTELNPGILQGLTHEQAAKKYSKYFEIWQEKDDLDKIPGAESGNSLQARAIFFLERYQELLEFSDIIVSHVGFNKSLINTALGQLRTEPIKTSLDYIHKLEDPWKNIHHTELSLAKSSKVYKIFTANSIYIMKRLHGVLQQKLEFQNLLSSYITRENNSFPKVLYWGMKNDNNSNETCGIQILNYLEGIHKYGPLTFSETKSVVRTVYDLFQRLKDFSASSEKISKFNLKNELTRLLFETRESKIKKLAEALMSNKRFNELLLNSEHVLVDYDLHRSNLLFAGSEVKVLDLGGIIYGPLAFQPASLFMACFLLEDLDNFNLENLIALWPEPLNVKDVILLMQARAFIGAAFFQRIIDRISHPSQENQDLFKRYCRAMQIISTSKYICQ